MSNNKNPYQNQQKQIYDNAQHARELAQEYAQTDDLQNQKDHIKVLLSGGHAANGTSSVYHAVNYVRNSQLDAVDKLTLYRFIRTKANPLTNANTALLNNANRGNNVAHVNNGNNGTAALLAQYGKTNAEAASNKASKQLAKQLALENKKNSERQRAKQIANNKATKALVRELQLQNQEAAAKQIANNKASANLAEQLQNQERAAAAVPDSANNDNSSNRYESLGGGKKAKRKTRKTKKTNKTRRCQGKTKLEKRCKTQITKGKKCHRH